MTERECMQLITFTLPSRHNTLAVKTISYKRCLTYLDSVVILPINTSASKLIKQKSQTNLSSKEKQITLELDIRSNTTHPLITWTTANKT